MRCLVTGADGFLGANLCKRLIADGHEVTGSALNRKGQTSLDALGINCRIEYGDVTDASFVQRIVSSSEAEWVFHLAAVSIVRIAHADPGRAIRTNVLGTLNVLEASRGRRVIVASSDKAYGDQGGKVYYEDMDLRPTGPYELSKAMADQLARSYGAIVTRCANLFGPADLNWSRLVPGSCRRALNGESPVVNAGAWNYRREWLSVRDAVAAYVLLAEKGQPGEAYNVGSGESLTAGEMAEAISDCAGGPRPQEEGQLGCYEIPSQELCSHKIRQLGWEPVNSGRLHLWGTVQWYHSYLELSTVMKCLES